MDVSKTSGSNSASIFIRTYLKVHMRIGEIKKLNVVPLCVLILILLKIPPGDGRMDLWTVAELFSPSPSPEIFRT
jgi:hypothetical protein